jgi:hypothetical protein
LCTVLFLIILNNVMKIFYLERENTSPTIRAVVEIYEVKLVDFCLVKLPDFLHEIFYYSYILKQGDVLLRRRFVPETLCYRRRCVTETFCNGDVLYGDVLSRRHFVRRRFVCAPEIGLLFFKYSVLFHSFIQHIWGKLKFG